MFARCLAGLLGVVMLAGCNTDAVSTPPSTVVGVRAKTATDGLRAQASEIKSDPKPSTAVVPDPAHNAPAPPQRRVEQAAPITRVEKASIPTPVISQPEAPRSQPVAMPVATVPPVRVTPAVTTAPPAPPRPEPTYGALVAVVVGAVAVGLVLISFYGNSETVRVRRQVRGVLAAFESVLKSQSDLIIKLQADASKAAADYAAGFRQSYMQRVPLDEIRRYAPGARLQPLRDLGMTNLLACQGWTSGRLQQLRGIGPDSASRIALAITALTKAVNNVAVPHPAATDMGVPERLYRNLYLVRQVQLKLADQMLVIDGILKELRPKCRAVEEQTTFYSWLVGSQKQGALKAALDDGRAIEGKTKLVEKEGAALGEARDRLTAAKHLVDGRIAAAAWVLDASDEPGYYRSALERLLGKNATPQAPIAPVRETGEVRSREEPATPRRVNSSPASEPVRVRAAGVESGSGFRISVRIGGAAIEPVPPEAESRSDQCWVPAGQKTRVGEFTIEGGLVYLGKNLPAVNGRSVEPALIDPALPIATREADCRVRMLDYWSNYSYASPAARASYLQWHMAGRSEPTADIGYVFLYFYGLERRALADAGTDAGARVDIPEIMREVRRLRSIYGQRGSFARYSTEFLDFLEAKQGASAGLTEMDQPPPLRQYHVSFGLRQKLGQLANARKPLPPEWAYTWFYNDPRTRLPAVVFRCPEQVAALFREEYARQLGDGLVLPAGKTRLKLTYRPASASFRESLVQSADLPDVSVLTASYAKLEAVAQECYGQLEAYGRLVTRNKEAAEGFEGLILLPVRLWPAESKAVLEGLRAKASDYTVCSWGEILELFEKREKLTRSVYMAFCRTLEDAGIGIEPDPRFGTEVPELEEPVALFPEEPGEKLSEAFGAAGFRLRLAAVVASADGDFSVAEAEHLQEEIEGTEALAKRERSRLRARMAVYQKKAPLLTGMKPLIATMSPEERRRATDFLIALVFADRTVAPAEVKVMEKIHSLFGLEPGALYTRLHELSVGGVATKPAIEPLKTGPMQLDAAKVRELRAASEEVTRKLAIIFNAETPPEEPIAKEIETDPAGVDPKATLLNLDVTHAELLLVLTGRSQWTRAEFEEVCADKGLMPDGAIERINEAAFTKFDQPVIEGDDPLEIILQLLEEQIYAAGNSQKGP